MEASTSPTSDLEDWAEQFDQSLDQQRERIREFLAAQQERLQHVENELAQQLQHFADELAQNRSETRQATEDIQQRSERLSRESEALECLKQEAASQQAEWEQLQQRSQQQHEALAEQIRRHQEEIDDRCTQLDRRRTEIDSSEATLHHDRQALELARQEHQAELEQVAALRARLEAKQAELDEQRQHVDARRNETETQRRHIAGEFRAQHAAHLKELDRRREELDRHELELAQRPAGDLASAEELGPLEAERDMLRVQLANAKQQLAEAGQGGGISDEDLQRRYDMAMDDLRELKQDNADLQRRLSQAPAAAAPAPAATGQALDWEAEKRRILDSLESDFDEEDEEDRKERLTIEELIRKTDEVIADKEQEISELKQLLENQSTSVGAMAVGAAALGEILESDAIIQEERENLKRVQEEWRDKLRTAEIEISLERATMARERAAIDEKLRILEKHGGAAGDQSGESAGSGKRAQGRWLAQLGLTSPEGEDKGKGKK